MKVWKYTRKIEADYKRLYKDFSADFALILYIYCWLL